jgi:hypothetical protein
VRRGQDISELDHGRGRAQVPGGLKVFSDGSIILIPPFRKGENSKELLVKSPFEKGGFRQHCPVRKLHAAVLPPSPQPSPPEAGGEGVEEVAGFSNHKALNQFTFSPSPPMGERAGVRGK